MRVIIVFYVEHFCFFLTKKNKTTSKYLCAVIFFFCYDILKSVISRLLGVCIFIEKNKSMTRTFEYTSFQINRMIF